MPSEPKTKRTKASVAAFIASVENETRRVDAKSIDKIFREITGEKPAMWGPSIVGYGSYDGPTGVWPRQAFSPRKSALVLYITLGLKDQGVLLGKLGKHKKTGGCLYINTLADVDEAVLRELIKRSVKAMKEKYP